MRPSEQMREHLRRQRELADVPLAERVAELERVQMEMRKVSAPAKRYRVRRSAPRHISAVLGEFVRDLRTMDPTMDPWSNQTSDNPRQAAGTATTDWRTP